MKSSNIYIYIKQKLTVIKFIDWLILTTLKDICYSNYLLYYIVTNLSSSI